MRKNYAKKCFMVDGDGVVSGAKFTFTNGKTLECPLSKVQPMLEMLAGHGLRQKVGDSYNQADTADQAYAVAVDVWSRLCDGIWEAERVGGWFGVSVEDLTHSVAYLKGCDYDTAKAAVEKSTEDQRKELARHPKVKAYIAKLRLERAEVAAEDAEDIELPM